MGCTTRFELVMFDLDGTLVATAPEIAQALNDTLRNIGLAPVELDHVERWIGHGTRRLVSQALASRTRVPSPAPSPAANDLADRAMEAFARHYAHRCGTGSRLYPGVREVLQVLGDRAVKRALVTNKEQHFTRLLLQRHGLLDLLDRVVCGDSLPRAKPDPAGITDCLHTFGVRPQRALFVGDSSIDVAAARNAGVAVWAVGYGYNMGKPIASSRPDRLLDTLEALLEQE
jgi:phosphoglycolate phosphatase